MSITADEFAKRCEGIASSGVPLRPAVEMCKEVLLMAIDDCFLRRQNPSGTPWPGRKDSKPHPLLEESGALRAAATSQAPGHIEEITDHSATVGVEKIELGGLMGALAHQFGYAKGNIPKREFLGISTDAMDICAEETADMSAQFLIKSWL